MLRHIPVLAQEIYDQLPSNRQLGFDGTFGHGGHAEFFLNHEEQKRPIDKLKIIGTDIDQQMIQKSKRINETLRRSDPDSPQFLCKNSGY